MKPRRLLLIACGLLVIAWALAPAVRAATLLARRPPVAERSIIKLSAGDTGQDVTFTASDGVRLAGTYLDVPAAKGVVVLVHGFKTYRWEMVEYVQLIHDAGYSVLFYDSRGCGPSEGVFGVGATEDRDIVGAVDFIQARKAAGWERIAVFGISLGAGDAILAGARDDRIRAVVADSPWIDEFVQLERMRSLAVGPLSIPLLPYEPALVDALIGGRLEDAVPAAAVAKIAPRAILLIHSLDDGNATTPVAGSERMFHFAGDPKELWLVPSGGHVGAIRAQPEEYRRRVIAFLAAALR